MKFVLFVEGYTERALPSFLKRWLDPQLPSPVGIQAVRFEGCAHYVEGIAKKVELHLTGKRGADVIAAVGLLDLYGLPIYPAHVKTAAERYAWAKEHLEQKVSHPRFRQHFAVHETEAWLLSDPSLFEPAVQKALPGKCAHPESVNFDEPPAKLLDRLYREKLRRRYGKVTDGANLFQALDPARAHGKCPGLRGMLDEMLVLVKEAG